MVKEVTRLRHELIASEEVVCDYQQQISTLHQQNSHLNSELRLRDQAKRTAEIAMEDAKMMAAKNQALQEQERDDMQSRIETLSSALVESQAQVTVWLGTLPERPTARCTLMQVIALQDTLEGLTAREMTVQVSIKELQVPAYVEYVSASWMRCFAAMYCHSDCYALNFLG